MIAVAPGDREPLRRFFRPERPGPNAGLHAIQHRVGRLLVDRAEAPRALIARAGVDHQLRGTPAALRAEDLREAELEGLVDAPPDFLPLLRAAYPDLSIWQRVIQTLAPGDVPPVEAEVRRLVRADVDALSGIEEDIRWIWQPFESARALCESGLAYGAFDAGLLLSVANAFNQGECFEDLGVVTASEARGRGLSTACAARVAADVRARGRVPSWSTSVENASSLAVARKLGGEVDREDVLYVIGDLP